MRSLLTLTALLALPLVTLAQQPQPPKPEAKPEAKQETKKNEAKKDEAKKPATTLEALMAAFNGESNAAARYTEFAKKADEEGYTQVASLFRAAAKAEQIHAKSHGEVIKKLGGTPKADIEKIVAKTTKENVEAALKGETYEKDTMYPDFLAQAKKEKNRDAIETFNMAKAAEVEHAKLYTAALGGLDGMKGSAAEPMYVCTVCGYTTSKIDFEKCPACFNPKDKYVKVS